MTDVIRKMVDDGDLSGAVTLVWQNGKAIQVDDTGQLCKRLFGSGNSFLPGYVEYTQKVRYRLVPYIW